MMQYKNLFSEYSVLIAEDDDTIREHMANTLKYYFKTVHQASSGKKALEHFWELNPSLVISDIKMSNGTGIELVNGIRKKDKYTPIIILSAYSDEEYLLQLINLKINQYLLKPTKSEDLFCAISNALLPKETKYELVENLILDMENCELRYNFNRISLRKKEASFLKLIHQNKHKITTYDMIQDSIWKDKIMTQNALKTFVKELRKKTPVNVIDNVIQEGYRLTYS